MKTAQGDRHTLMDNMRDDTRTFLDSAQKTLREQHQRDHDSRVAFLVQLRDDIETSLTVFREKLADDSASDRQARRDAFSEQVAAARAERARYYQRYRRNVDGVEGDGVEGDTGATASRGSSSKTSTSKSKARKSSRKSSTASKQKTGSASSDTDLNASQDDTVNDVNDNVSNTVNETVNNTAANTPDSMAAALLVLVEQKPGSSAATLAEGLDGVDSSSVQNQLDAFVVEGKVKSRNRGYYLVVTPKSDNDAGSDGEVSIT
jgi:hypothetical protein